MIRREPGSLFGGLGAWVDMFDFGSLQAGKTVARMKGAGVRTLYLQTGTGNTKPAVLPGVKPWLVAAHRAGIKVVGWYVPSYANVDRDVRHTVAIARFRSGAHRFDGLGVDIEERQHVRRLSTWNRRVTSHLRRVRTLVGQRYPIASIAPPPLQMRVAASSWRGFPWKAIAKQSDAVVLMSYWTPRSGCPRLKHHCAYGFTAGNVSLTRRLIARPAAVIHVIGGIGDRMTVGQVRAFVKAAKDSNADGASIYDVATTRVAWWRNLSRLRRLGD